VILYSKADNSNRKRIAQGFPELANAFNDWQHAEGAFTDEPQNEYMPADLIKFIGGE